MEGTQHNKLNGSFSFQRVISTETRIVVQGIWHTAIEDIHAVVKFEWETSRNADALLYELLKDRGLPVEKLLFSCINAEQIQACISNYDELIAAIREHRVAQAEAAVARFNMPSQIAYQDGADQIVVDMIVVDEVVVLVEMNVFQFIEGISLQKYLRQLTINHLQMPRDIRHNTLLAIKKALCHQILATSERIHRLGVVWGDLCMKNMIVGPLIETDISDDLPWIPEQPTCFICNAGVPEEEHDVCVQVYFIDFANGCTSPYARFDHAYPTIAPPEGCGDDAKSWLHLDVDNLSSLVMGILYDLPANPRRTPYITECMEFFNMMQDCENCKRCRNRKSPVEPLPITQKYLTIMQLIEPVRPARNVEIRE
jgi:hypothetical protein